MSIRLEVFYAQHLSFVSSNQIFGGAGVCGDFPLARALVGLRTLRIADGPDAVHKQSLALFELKKAKQRMQSRV